MIASARSNPLRERERYDLVYSSEFRAKEEPRKARRAIELERPGLELHDWGNKGREREKGGRLAVQRRVFNVDFYEEK